MKCSFGFFIEGAAGLTQQISYALRLTESGTPGADVYRQLGVSEASFYVCKKKYGKLGLAELKELRQLRERSGTGGIITLDVLSREPGEGQSAAFPGRMLALARDVAG